MHWMQQRALAALPFVCLGRQLGEEKQGDRSTLGEQGREGKRLHSEAWKDGRETVQYTSHSAWEARGGRGHGEARPGQAEAQRAGVDQCHVGSRAGQASTVSGANPCSPPQGARLAAAGGALPVSCATAAPAGPGPSLLLVVRLLLDRRLAGGDARKGGVLDAEHAVQHILHCGEAGRRRRRASMSAWRGQAREQCLLPGLTAAASLLCRRPCCTPSKKSGRSLCPGPPPAGSPALSGVEAPEVTPMVMGPSGSQFSVSTSSPCASLWVTWAAAGAAAGQGCEVGHMPGRAGKAHAPPGAPPCVSDQPTCRAAAGPRAGAPTARAHLVCRHVDARRRVHPEGWDALHLTDFLQNTSRREWGLSQQRRVHACFMQPCIHFNGG